MIPNLHFVCGAIAALSFGASIWCAVPSKSARYWYGYNMAICTVLLASLAIFATMVGAGQ